MAWYHVGGCDCPVGCCDCGDPKPVRTCLIYNSRTDEVVVYQGHYNFRRGQLVPWDKSLVFLENEQQEEV